MLMRLQQMHDEVDEGRQDSVLAALVLRPQGRTRLVLDTLWVRCFLNCFLKDAQPGRVARKVLDVFVEWVESSTALRAASVRDLRDRP